MTNSDDEITDLAQKAMGKRVDEDEYYEQAGLDGDDDEEGKV